MRTDIHRPSVFVPGNYTYILSYALPSVMDGYPVPSYNVDTVVRLQNENTFAATGHLGKCSVCGAAYIYGDVWQHVPTQEFIHIGHDCADKYALMADRSEYELSLNRLREATAREISRKVNAEERKAFLDSHPGLEEALTTDHHIIRDIASRFTQFRTLSDKQVALVLKISNEAKNPQPTETHIDAPTGKVTFTGVVVSAKTMEGMYGVSYKMTVKVTTPAGVWLAWGTIPAAMLESVPVTEGGRLQALKGATVEVRATLKQGNDKHFAITNRPTGRVVSLKTA